MTSLRASFERAKENLRARASSRSSSKPAENPPTNGTTLKVKGYVEVKRLGKGSFGHAKLVMREDTREPFCAKFVNYKGMRPAEKEYVAREVRTMTHLSKEGGHPYLVKFRESFVLSSGLLCIVMDFCDGGDLAQQIAVAKRKRTRFAEEQVHLWLLQLLSATDYLHQQQVLHRDIKPANVFMHAGTCKLGDLGLSKQTMSAATQPGAHTQCGSPLYLAPEVHMGQPYSKKIDLWAVGCTLFEVMMLAPAFQGVDNARILQNIVWARHAQIDGGWSAPLVALLEALLRLKPDDRPDAGDAIEDPLFAPALQSGHLHPKALRHQQGLSNIDLSESPTSVLGVAADVQSVKGKAARRPAPAPSVAAETTKPYADGARPMVMCDMDDDLRNLAR